MKAEQAQTGQQPAAKPRLQGKSSVVQLPPTG